ncbi:MAG TPA: SDR family NAD(P)-dependent oxidoreductase, partial [Acidimicrobiales bacterium]
MATRLSERTVLVVGAGTQPSDEPDAPIGNGRAISVLAARAGAHVVCVDRDAAAAEQTAALVRSEAADATVVVGDVTSADDCAAMVGRAAEAGGGRLDGVVVNVGIGRGGGLAGTSPEDWDATMATNLRGHFLVARAALEALGNDGTVGHGDSGGSGGSIVFIGSVAGLQPGSRLPAYDASKAGLIGLARHVALEGARRGVRANVVAPGLIDTPLGRLA